ncbi:MAG: 1-deoxy-D-xylulose-5-phosphate reductoisomerase [Deltaproteobacteria bacterium]|nr:1-deoxy-D-xylulose-5-phosphate reductoisomerase [Deltaproteobacteria bacterium]
MKNLVLLGSTGSIGVSTLEIVAAYPERFRVLALTGNYNVDALAQQVRRFSPRLVAVPDAARAQVLRELVPDRNVEVLSGLQGLRACAALAEADLVVSAITGFAGLEPTLAAIEAGHDVALANKETLVAAGALVTSRARALGVRIYPVDSEHSAIFQALQGQREAQVRRLILTASGGPFYQSSPEEIERATPEAALNHPRWRMGKKVTIDSATMMNKGLEVIEAHWLFDMPEEKIAVQIHPQSVVHSMVEYVDGALIAQMGVPDMKIPIAYALAFPERLALDLPPLDLCTLGSLTFAAPDDRRFPCLSIAREALRQGGTVPAVMNAANEVAVACFLNKTIQFGQIAEVIRATLEQHSPSAVTDLETVIEADRKGRQTARRIAAAKENAQ